MTPRPDVQAEVFTDTVTALQPRWNWFCRSCVLRRGVMVWRLASFLCLSGLSLGSKGYPETSYYSYSVTYRRNPNSYRHQPVVLICPLLFIACLQRCVAKNGNDFVCADLLKWQTFWSVNIFVPDIEGFYLWIETSHTVYFTLHTR